MSVEVRLLAPSDAWVFDHVSPDVFDEPIDARWSAEFLADARHHLAVALDGALLVGMASAVHYVHPDKPPELWINEVGVAGTHRRQGIAARLLEELFMRGRELGCSQAWVLADESNHAAHALYERAGGVAARERAVMFEFDLLEAHRD
ncbi:MAG TPA: GNAT family N-acetyltransferase [Gemmatimonadales bacterium]